MKALFNKFFLFGVIGLLLIAIPITLYFVKQQENVTSNAAPSSNLSLNPSTTSVKVGDQFNVSVAIDPGQNIVSYVKFNLLFDPQKLQAVNITPSSSFPLTLGGPTITSGSASMSVGIGLDVTKAIQAPTQVAVITFRALAPTDAAPTQISFDSGNTQILSLAAADHAGENVLSNTSPSSVTILNGSQTANSTPTPTSPATATPTSTPTPLPTSTPAVSVNNIAPTCTGLTISPTASGSAPLSVTLQGSGSDSDGLISKATFDFGDGQAQDVTSNLNLSSVNPQVEHTYQNAGTFTASVVFTDNAGAVSTACTSQVFVNTAQAAPVQQSTPAATATPRPTLAATGSSALTFGIIGAVFVTLIGAGVLFVL